MKIVDNPRKKRLSTECLTSEANNDRPSYMITRYAWVKGFMVNAVVSATTVIFFFPLPPPSFTSGELRRTCSLLRVIPLYFKTMILLESQAQQTDTPLVQIKTVGEHGSLCWKMEILFNKRLITLEKNHR